jgi:hypothetical protein
LQNSSSGQADAKKKKIKQHNMPTTTNSQEEKKQFQKKKTDGENFVNEKTPPTKQRLHLDI